MSKARRRQPPLDGPTVKDRQLEQDNKNGRAGGREVHERIARLAAICDERDAALIECVVNRGCSIADIARCFGADPNPLYRRLAVLKRQAQNPTVLLIYECRDQWPPPLSEILVRHFVRGEGVDPLCEEFNVPAAWVNKYIKATQKWATERLRQRNGEGP